MSVTHMIEKLTLMQTQVDASHAQTCADAICAINKLTLMLSTLTDAADRAAWDHNTGLMDEYIQQAQALVNS